VIIHDLFYNGQPDADSRIFVISMKAFKNFEDMVGILRVKSNSIIGNGYVAVIFCNIKIFISDYISFCNNAGNINNRVCTNV